MIKKYKKKEAESGGDRSVKGPPTTQGSTTHFVHEGPLPSEESHADRPRKKNIKKGPIPSAT